MQIQKGNNSGRTTDLKQQSTRESWVSPRKRRLSSEKDNIERQSVENCEKRQTEPVSPVLKRIKRCLRSEAPNSSEEDSPIKSDKESAEQRSTVVDNDADFQGTKRACRCLILDDCEKREIKKVNVSEEGPLNSAVVEEITGYLAVNGVDDSDSAGVNSDDCQPDGNTKQNSTGSYPLQEKSVAENGDSDTHTSVFLDSRKEDSYIDHNVPCTNSEVQVKLEDHKRVTACVPVEHVNQMTTEPATGPFPEIQSLRDSEEEADVVGDSSASKEQCNESTNNALDTRLERMPDSGELEPSSILDGVSAQTMSLSEPQEHRYTLRTSPRRAAPTRSSPTKNSSPCRENGQLEENNLSPNETNVTVSDNISESPTNPDEVSQNDKRICCDSENYGSEGQSKPPSEARLNSGNLPSAKESANPHITEEEDDDPDVYYFESDHVALKHNKEYV